MYNYCRVTTRVCISRARENNALHIIIIIGALCTRVVCAHYDGGGGSSSETTAKCVKIQCVITDLG